GRDPGLRRDRQLGIETAGSRHRIVVAVRKAEIGSGQLPELNTGRVSGALLPRPAKRGEVKDLKSSDYTRRLPDGSAAPNPSPRTCRACAVRTPGFRPPPPVPACWMTPGLGPSYRPRP